jgi:hypothetical protein
MRTAFWVGCFIFTACTGPNNPVQVSTYPSATALLDAVLPSLEMSKDTFYQNLYYHGEKPITQPMDTPVKWKEVLEVFYTLDISKPALQDLYQVEETTKDSVRWMHYTTKEEKLPVKSFSLHLDSLGCVAFTGKIRKENLISGHEVNLSAHLRNMDFAYEGRRWTLWSTDTVPFGVRVFK